MITKSVHTDLIYIIANRYKANIIQRSCITQRTINENKINQNMH